MHSWRTFQFIIALFTLSWDLWAEDEVAFNYTVDARRAGPP